MKRGSIFVKGLFIYNIIEKQIIERILKTMGSDNIDVGTPSCLGGLNPKEFVTRSPLVQYASMAIIDNKSQS